MPRFLDTKTGQFVWVSDPKGVRYAILSHTWYTSSEGGEQTYEDILRVQAAAAAEEQGISGSNASQPSDEALPGTRPSILHRPELSEKIRGFCTYAQKAGYDFAWADMCCIDKSSSAELSEAINSMFEWYRLANVCYVYLADVSYTSESDESDVEFSIHTVEENLRRIRKEFRESRWHTRGWTLQELLAPRPVVFLSRTWAVLGNKLGVARILEEITGVDASILTGRAELASASVAQRMSWAAHRETTRVEDRAYSLMGIFGVFMSPVYGEGHNAFLRLQEEIIRTIPDQSIFAWGSYVDISARSHSTDVVTVGPMSDNLDIGLRGEALLAQSPLVFKYSSDIGPVPSTQFARLLGTKHESLPHLHCVFTPQGISIQLPCIDTTARRLYTRVMDIFAGSPRFDYGHLALLRCRVRDGPFIALPLSSKSKAKDDDHLKVDPHLILCSTDDVSSLNVFGRTIRLNERFFKAARGRGWKLLMQNTLLLASEPHSTYTDWKARAHTVTKTLSSRLVLELAPWCDGELDTLGFSTAIVDSDVPPPTHSHGFNAFTPISFLILPHPGWSTDDNDEALSFFLDVEVIVEEWAATTPATALGRNLHWVDPTSDSPFSVTLTHRRMSHADSDASVDDSEASEDDSLTTMKKTVIAMRARLLHVSTLSQSGATLYAERDFQIPCADGIWRSSPFNGLLLRMIVQSAPPKKSPGDVPGEPILNLDGGAQAERFWVSLELTESM